MDHDWHRPSTFTIFRDGQAPEAFDLSHEGIGYQYEIMEVGTHAELIEFGGIYARLYAEQFRAMGLNAKGFLGYRYRANEIARLVKEADAELLIIGAHGHSGIKDWLYGETIEAVRHQLRIPVLVVNG